MSGASFLRTSERQVRVGRLVDDGTWGHDSESAKRRWWEYRGIGECLLIVLSNFLLVFMAHINDSRLSSGHVASHGTRTSTLVEVRLRE